MGHRHRAVGFLGARILVRDHGEQVENSSWNAVRVGMSRALCIGKKEERGNVCTQARRNPWGRKAKGIPYISISLSLEFRSFLSPFGLYRFFSSQFLGVAYRFKIQYGNHEYLGKCFAHASSLLRL